jgi:hypothetical protein
LLSVLLPASAQRYCCLLARHRYCCPARAWLQGRHQREIPFQIEGMLHELYILAQIVQGCASGGSGGLAAGGSALARRQRRRHTSALTI